ncbi:hypothetical protein ACFLWU_01570 [Chloroflexota bacterium]
MRTKSAELDLMLILTESMYRKPLLEMPESVDWEAFIKLARRNKFLYHATNLLLESQEAELSDEIQNRFKAIQQTEAGIHARMQRTLEVVNSVMGTEPYLLSKTWRVFPYVTHDVDLIVHDLDRPRQLFEAAGYAAPSSAHPYSIWVREKGLLEIEPYLRPFAGPMAFMDDDFMWERSRKVVFEGVETVIPSAEVDILTHFADMGFRLYELLLGDMLHLFRMAPEADWDIIMRQAEKHSWLGQLKKNVAVMNGFHRQLYGEPGPMEKFIPHIGTANVTLPYVTPVFQVIRALKGKGWINLAKLVAYLSVKLKRFPRLHKFYTKVVMGYPENLFLKYFYH